MRTLIAVIVLALAVPVAGPGCQTAPTARSAEVSTLKVVGAAVDSSMKVAAGLLRDGKITRAQWDKLADYHDRVFQPAYNLAVAAVQADLSSVASPDLLDLFGRLTAIVASFQHPSPLVP